MIDQIVANVCTYMAMKAGCQETLKQASDKINLSKEVDDSEREVVKYTTKEVYNDVHLGYCL